MSCIHYKFKSSLEYDTLTFDGLHISLADLKKAIIEHKKLGKSGDFHLQITDAQTKQAYVVDSELIPRNASVIVTRVPIGGVSIKSKIVEEALKASAAAKLPHGSSSLYDVGSKYKPAPSVQQQKSLSEDDRILSMMQESGKDYDPSKYVRSKYSSYRPKWGYVCKKCGKEGHFITECTSSEPYVKQPTALKRTTGIPKEFLTRVSDPTVPGAKKTSEGFYAVPTIDKAAYAKGKKERPPFLPSEEAKGLIVDETKLPIPGELVCPLCKGMLREAVVIPCCGTSFCDECVRDALMASEDQQCPMDGCGELDVTPNSLIPNKFLRTCVTNFLNDSGYAQMKQKRIEDRESSPFSNNNSPQVDQPKDVVVPTQKKENRPTLPDITIPFDLVGLPPQVIQAKLRERVAAAAANPNTEDAMEPSSDDLYHDLYPDSGKGRRSPISLPNRPNTPTTPIHDEDLFPEPPKYIGDQDDQDTADDDREDTPPPPPPKPRISSHQVPKHQQQQQPPPHLQGHAVQPPLIVSSAIVNQLQPTVGPVLSPALLPTPSRATHIIRAPPPGVMTVSPHHQPMATGMPPAGAIPPGTTVVPVSAAMVRPPSGQMLMGLPPGTRPMMQTVPSQGFPQRPHFLPGPPQGHLGQRPPGMPQLQMNMQPPHAGMQPGLPPNQGMPPQQHLMSGQLPTALQLRGPPPPFVRGPPPQGMPGLRGPPPNLLPPGMHGQPLQGINGPPLPHQYPDFPAPPQRTGSPPRRDHLEDAAGPKDNRPVLSEEEFYRRKKLLKKEERPTSSKRHVYESRSRIVAKEEKDRKKRDAYDDFMSGLEQRDRDSKEKKDLEKRAKEETDKLRADTANKENESSDGGSRVAKSRSRSRTPSKRSKSPIRRGSATPPRKGSRSPGKKGSSRSPFRRRSFTSRTPSPRIKRTYSSRSPPPRKGSYTRSPNRKRSYSRSLSPRKRSRTPLLRKRSFSRSPRGRSFSRSPKRSFSPGGKRKLLSPRRRSFSRSLSPRKRSYSPRKGSLTPRKRSYSPGGRKRSLSPRKRSLTPRKRSRTPTRKRSFSPKRRSFSRSPPPKGRPFSRSPGRKRSRTPLKRRSYSGSPNRKRSFSRSPPPRKRSFTPKRKMSPNRRSRSFSPMNKKKLGPPLKRRSKSPIKGRKRSLSRSPPPRNRSRSPPRKKKSFSRTPPPFRRRSRSFSPRPWKDGYRRSRSRSPWRGKRRSPLGYGRKRSPFIRRPSPPRRRSPSPYKARGSSPYSGPPIVWPSESPEPSAPAPAPFPPINQQQAYYGNNSGNRGGGGYPQQQPAVHDNRNNFPGNHQRNNNFPPSSNPPPAVNRPPYPNLNPVDRNFHPPPSNNIQSRLGYNNPPPPVHPGPGPAAGAPAPHFGRNPPPPGTEDEFMARYDRVQPPADTSRLPTEWIDWYKQLHEYRERLNRYAANKGMPAFDDKSGKVDKPVRSWKDRSISPDDPPPHGHGPIRRSRSRSAGSRNTKRNKDDRGARYDSRDGKPGFKDNRDKDKPGFKDNRDKDKPGFKDNRDKDKPGFKDNRDKDKPRFKDNRDRDTGFKDNRDRDTGFKDNRDRDTGFKDNRDRDAGFKDNRDRDTGFKDNRDRDTGFKDNRDRDRDKKDVSSKNDKDKKDSLSRYEREKKELSSKHEKDSYRSDKEVSKYDKEKESSSSRLKNEKDFHSKHADRDSSKRTEKDSKTVDKELEDQKIMELNDPSKLARDDDENHHKEEKVKEGKTKDKLKKKEKKEKKAKKEKEKLIKKKEKKALKDEKKAAKEKNTADNNSKDDGSADDDDKEVFTGKAIVKEASDVSTEHVNNDEMNANANKSLACSDEKPIDQSIEDADEHNIGNKDIKDDSDKKNEDDEYSEKTKTVVEEEEKMDISVDRTESTNVESKNEMFELEPQISVDVKEEEDFDDTSIKKETDIKENLEELEEKKKPLKKRSIWSNREKIQGLEAYDSNSSAASPIKKKDHVVSPHRTNIDYKDAMTPPKEEQTEVEIHRSSHVTTPLKSVVASVMSPPVKTTNKKASPLVQDHKIEASDDSDRRVHDKKPKPKVIEDSRVVEADSTSMKGYKHGFDVHEKSGSSSGGRHRKDSGDRGDSGGYKIKMPELSKWERESDSDTDEDREHVMRKKKLELKRQKIEERTTALPKSVIDSAANMLATKPRKGAVNVTMPYVSTSETAKTAGRRVFSPPESSKTAGRLVFIESDKGSSKQGKGSLMMTINTVQSPPSKPLSIKDRLGKKVLPETERRIVKTASIPSVKDRLGQKQKTASSSFNRSDSSDYNKKSTSGGADGNKDSSNSSGGRRIKLNRDFSRDGGSSRESGGRDRDSSRDWRGVRNSLDAEPSSSSSRRDADSHSSTARRTDKSESGSKFSSKSSKSSKSKSDRKISLAEEEGFEPDYHDYDDDDEDHSYIDRHAGKSSSSHKKTTRGESSDTSDSNASRSRSRSVGIKRKRVPVSDEDDRGGKSSSKKSKKHKGKLDKEPKEPKDKSIKKHKKNKKNKDKDKDR